MGDNTNQAKFYDNNWVLGITIVITLAFLGAALFDTGDGSAGRFWIFFGFFTVGYLGVQLLMYLKAVTTNGKLDKETGYNMFVAVTALVTFSSVAVVLSPGAGKAFRDSLGGFNRYILLSVMVVSALLNALAWNLKVNNTPVSITISKNEQEILSNRLEQV